jgi:hypothetical protein
MVHLRYTIDKTYIEPNTELCALVGYSPINLSHLTRYGTSSAVKHVHLLYGISWSTPESEIQGDIVCLVDGFGGDSRYMCERFPQSMVHWNSLQDSFSLLGPGMAFRKGPAFSERGYPANLSFISQMNYGSDITKSYVMSELVERVPHPFIIKCDADLPNQKDETRGHTMMFIWRNTTLYFIRNAVPEGVLILMVFTDLPDLLASLKTSLQQSVSNVRILRLVMSHTGYERFIIAAGIYN